MESIVMFREDLKKSIHEYDLESVNVKRFDHGKQRFNMFMIVLTLLSAIIGSHLFGNATKYVTKKLNYKERIITQYNKRKYSYESVGDIYPRSYKEYSLSIYNSHYKNQLIFIYFIHTAWLIPLFLLPIWRAPFPIRFNRKKQLIYTWHRGKFYYARPDQLNYKNTETDYIENSNSNGPLEISLYTKGNDKAKYFRLGAYPAFHLQSYALREWLDNYMNHAVLSDSFQERKNTWIEKCLLSGKKLPQDKTEKALLEITNS
jgi:hypothetical protein